MTGKLMSFEEAETIGLVNTVFPKEGFRERVLDYASEFVPPKKAAKAVGRIKRAVCSGLEAPFSEALALERELQQQLFVSNDAREGLAAHLEKREAEFKGN